MQLTVLSLISVVVGPILSTLFICAIIHPSNQSICMFFLYLNPYFYPEFEIGYRYIEY